MPPKTQKSKKVAKASHVSDSRMLAYANRLMENKTTATEFPASIEKKLGDGRFRVKNLKTSEETVATLSKSLYVGKRAARNDKTQVALRERNIVLVDDGLITAKIDSDWFGILKKHMDLPTSAANAAYEFNAFGGRRTRKNRK